MQGGTRPPLRGALLARDHPPRPCCRCASEPTALRQRSHRSSSAIAHGGAAAWRGGGTSWTAPSRCTRASLAAPAAASTARGGSGDGGEGTSQHASVRFASVSHPAHASLLLAAPPPDVSDYAWPVTQDELHSLCSAALVAPTTAPAVAHRRPLAAHVVVAPSADGPSRARAHPPGYLRPLPWALDVAAAATAGGVQRQRQLAAVLQQPGPQAASGAAAAEPAPLDAEDSDASAAAVWSGDASLLPALPPRAFGRALLRCAEARVPLRPSALQAYADALAARAAQLPAAALVDALEGMGLYGGGGGGGGGADGGSRGAAQRPSAPPPAQLPVWAQQLLQALLQPAADSAAPAAGNAGGLSGPEAGARTKPPNSHARVAGLTPDRAADVLRLLAALDARPRPTWLESYFYCTAALVPCMSGSALLRALRALPALGAAPGAEWWGAALDAWAPPPPGVTLARAPAVAGVPVSTAGPGEVTREPQPSAKEVRCALLHTASQVALPSVVLRSLQGGWAADALADAVRGTVLLGGGGSSSSNSSSGDQSAGSLPPLAAALALAALPRVLADAKQWAAGPAGGAVLAGLLGVLEPRLRLLPPRALLDVLQGLCSAGLHPGRGFLRLHEAAVRALLGSGGDGGSRGGDGGGKAAAPSRSDVLETARLYAHLGHATTGSLRSAIRDAREQLRRERKRGRGRGGAAPAAPRRRSFRGGGR